MRAFDDEVALTIAPFYLVHMLQRTFPAGFIALVCVVVVTLVLLALALASCSHPYRFDPVRQDQEELQQRQNECIARGGTSEKCRP
jgi:hypothetical protein